MNNKLIVLVGDSASGKSSIAKELIESFDYKKLVTYTTRSPRKGEVDGIDYHFVDKDTMDKMITDKAFFDIAQYAKWYYAAPTEPINQKTVVILTPIGFRRAKKQYGSRIVSFYINVPRRDRLIKELQRGDDIEEAYRRNLSDVGMFDGIAEEVDYVINNEGYHMNPHYIANKIVNIVDIGGIGNINE